MSGRTRARIGAALSAALGLLRRVERCVIVTLLLTMVALYAANVLVRLTGSPLAARLHWVDEVVRIMNVYVVFLAAGLALERGRQIAVDTWRDSLEAATRVPLRRIIDAVGLVFSGYLAWISLEMALFVFATGQQSATLALAMGWLYLAPALGFALLALRYGASLAGAVDRFPPKEEAEA